MPEETKPTQSDKKDDAKKMVPEADLFAVKKGALERENKLKEELAKAKDALAQAQSEAKIAKMNVEDDEEISKVREYLVDEEKRIRAERDKFNNDLSAFGEREKAVRAKELVAQAKERYGVDITVDTIMTEENMEAKVSELCLEHLAKEKEKSSSESVYETSPGGTIKVQPKDMSEEEFDKYVKAQRNEALSKR